MNFTEKLNHAFTTTNKHVRIEHKVRRRPNNKSINFLESAKQSLSRSKRVTDHHNTRIDSILEALDGMATPGDVQPNELFVKFARALRVLGTKLGIGPIQDVLKEKGIKWKKSDDLSSIIIYVDNSQTGAAQPITRITPEDLDKPKDFEDKLLDMLDFAKGKAPGSFKQQQEMIRKQEQLAREIAKAAMPQADSSDNAIPQLMGAPAEDIATTQAVLPK